MGQTSILYPVFALIFLTFLVMFRMAFCRIGAVQRGETKLRDIALTGDAWPDEIRKLGNNFNNLFQVPVLFYVLAVLLMITRSVDFTHLVLAWIFVASRYLHSYIHTGSNNVRQRLYAYAFGNMVLLIMWGYFATDIITRSS